MNYLLLASALLGVVILGTAAYLLLVWWRRRRYTRERFAFAVAGTIGSLTLALFAAVGASTMPWHLMAALLRSVTGQEIQIPEPQFADYGLLFLTYVVAVRALIGLHRQWDGLKSLEQYQREQRRELPSLISEVVSEVLRFREHRGEPRPLAEENLQEYAGQLRLVSEQISWKDEARDLVELSTRSYRFDDPTAWHAGLSCWVGTDRDTGSPVVLLVKHDQPKDEDFQTLIEHSRETSPESQAAKNLIIATRGATPSDLAERADASAIQLASRELLLSRVADFTDYRNEIKRRVEELTLPDSRLTLKDVYVEPEVSSAEGSIPLGELISAWLKEPSQKQLALLGEYGQGKSTAATMLCYEALQGHLDLSGRVPLLIELRGTSPRNLSPLELLGAWASRYDLSPRALMRLHMAGKLLLIFEGFDEMALVGDAEMRLKHFQTLWEFCYPKARILITGRPNFFFDESEMKSALGLYQPTSSGMPSCEAIRLKKFDSSRIKAALRAHPNTVKNEIPSLAEENLHFCDLVSRPSLLHVVSILWDRENLSEKIDQLTSAYVMSLFVKHSYRRQGLKATDGADFMALTSAERSYFMSGIASHMAAKHLPNQISGLQLNDAISTLIDAIPNVVARKVSMVAGETTVPLSERIKDAPEHGLEHIRTDVRTCGLLVDDLSSPGTFRFGHKSFMEFLVAGTMVDKLQNSSDPVANSIHSATGLKIEHIVAIPEVTDFLAEALSSAALSAGEKPRSIVGRCRDLLRVLLGTSQPRRWLLQPFIWFILFLSCLQSGTSRPRRLIGISMAPHLWPGWLSLAFLYLFNRESFRPLFESSDNEVSMIFGMLLMATFMFGIPLAVMMMMRDLVLRLRLWNVLVKRLGITTLQGFQALSAKRMYRLWGERPFDVFLVRIAGFPGKGEALLTRYSESAKTPPNKEIHGTLKPLGRESGD